MASVDVRAEAPPAWAPANPWCWVGLAVAATGFALGWVQLLGNAVPAVRFMLIVVGLLCAAVAVWLRLRSSAPVLDSLSEGARGGLVMGLAAVDLGLAALTTLLLVLH